MQIRKGEKSYKCSQIETLSGREIHRIKFSILEPISQVEVANLFDDDMFYFYDDDLKVRMVETNDTKLVGVRITYNADSTCDILIKLLKGVAYDES